MRSSGTPWPSGFSAYLAAEMAADYEQIIYEVEDPVATITLNRPDVLNAWTDQMGAEVRDAVMRAEHDRRVVGLVLTGAGRGFCAGADMRSLTGVLDGDRSSPNPPPGPGDALADFDGDATYLLACRKPVVAAINGPIAGMAVPIVLCCDLRFMAEDAVLVTAFAERGLVAELGISWLLPRLIGPAAALDLLLSSRRISGREAERLGLVCRALPGPEVLPHAQAYIRDLAARCSPSSLATMKYQVYAQLHSGLGAAEREARALMEASFDKPDFEEGVRSFLERRPPRFRRLGD